ncbi:hypothetical protein Vretimale_14117 [Volvox reticuliferus]|uniref:Uncharacterized protein n=1 Tax=Volvox reticuliferus TaxID=1737510 RepID=A0A8J4GMV4_9CHLO|nr:hypothetical protein Vretifemale_16172 [Volvox reticuliferus]GIM10375.1 hypothetical protein Vretimale_14117 [Volvox reticuliferus]
MAELVANSEIATVQQFRNEGGDHCEAASSLSEHASSDISAASSVADEMHRFSALPSTRPAKAANASTKGESRAPLFQPRAASPPTSGGLQTQTHLKVVVVGASNLGKTRFIADLIKVFGNASVHEQKSAWENLTKMPSPQRASSLNRSSSLSVTLDLYPEELIVNLPPLELPEGSGRVLCISMLDAPAYDVEPNQDIYLAKLLEYILWQRVVDYRAANSKGGGGHGRVDCALQPPRTILLCLYFLPPYEVVSRTDLVFMSALSQVAPLLPVIAVGPTILASGETLVSEERLEMIRLAVVAAMEAYVRNGKPAPIMSLEQPTGMRVDGSSLPPEAPFDVKLFMELLHFSMGDLVQSDETRFEHFRQCYEAYGNDLMCLLSELLEPYDNALRSSVATVVTTPAPVSSCTSAAADHREETTSRPQVSTAQELPKHPPMPPTPELLVSIKSRERDASAGSSAVVQHVPGAAAAAMAGSEIVAIPAATARTFPSGEMVRAAEELAAEAMAGREVESELERIVSAIEDIVEHLAASIQTEMRAEQLSGDCSTMAHRPEQGKITTGDAAATPGDVEQLAAAPGNKDEDATAVVHSIGQRALSAVAVDAATENDAAAVQSAVRRVFTVVIAKAATRENEVDVRSTIRRAVSAAIANVVTKEDEAAVQNTVHRVFTVVIANAAEKENEAAVRSMIRRALAATIGNAVMNEDEADVRAAAQRGCVAVTASSTPDSYVAGGVRGIAGWQQLVILTPSAAAAAVRRHARAVTRLVHQSLTALYDQLDVTRLAAAAACVAIADAARSSTTGGLRSSTAGNAHEDVAAIVRGVAHRAVAAVVASTDGAPATNAEKTKGEEVVAALVRRVIARIVERAAIDDASSAQGMDSAATAQRKGVLQRMRSLLASTALSRTGCSSGARTSCCSTRVEAFSPKCGPMGLSLGVGLGIGMVGLAAGTLVVLAVRHKQTHT